MIKSPVQRISEVFAVRAGHKAGFGIEADLHKICYTGSDWQKLGKNKIANSFKSISQ